METPTKTSSVIIQINWPPTLFPQNKTKQNKKLRLMLLSFVEKGKMGLEIIIL